ncbi:MAG: type II toxin-antitoxin system RelE/ParE family toxin [Bacteroidetes bacterium]|nr:type II toxin-antitoxin system RelE/ParE family toxin [Bacteroidota bacterium]MCL1969528.1 type II toxin-antitoxin system RelE/ParE family toxin [Bacteroidota bacterium]
MADNEVIDKENPVFSIELSLRYEKNLQAALDYTFQEWGAVTMVNFYLQIIKEIDKLVFFPYSNAQNRFLGDINYREIILRKYPFVITYRINKYIVKIINIIHTSRNPIKRKAMR